MMRATILAAAALFASAAHAETTAAVMQRVFDPMSALLATSFDREAFAAPDSRAATLARMKELQAGLGAFESHMKTQNRTFQFVADSLARDVPAMIERFERGAYDEARFTLHSLTDNCIACHSSLPSNKTFPAGEAFVAKVDAAKLTPFDRAHLFVMSRQFDKALVEYEDILSSRAVDPSVVVLLGAFSDYLRVSIGVKNDLKRPIPVLEAIKKRPSTMLHVREQIDKWLAALKQLEKDKTMEKPTLAEARKLMTAGDAQMEFVRDRDGMIHFVAAEALLTRIVNDPKTKGDDLGEAYYLLGLASDLLEHSIWLRRSEFYLETAIRLAPRAPFAEKAYMVLEERLVADYSGSGGTHVPDDVKALLKELREMITNARRA